MHVEIGECGVRGICVVRESVVQWCVERQMPAEVGMWCKESVL